MRNRYRVSGQNGMRERSGSMFPHPPDRPRFASNRARKATPVPIETARSEREKPPNYKNIAVVRVLYQVADSA